ncbi:MAG: (Na+)-NQR maturation NqrM [Gammaproteobacteria bacterium]|nr:(Na+)-NQR maturation NqrM [Gammaproteobacteria bacterium]
MIYVLAFVVMAVIVIGMSVGVMAGRKPIAGSCGGIGATGVTKECGICGGDVQKCEEANPTDKAGNLRTDLARDATKTKVD